jgi:hypothetical protein
MKQLKVSLPDDLRAQLDAAAAGSGQSLAQEIRRRLERTLAEDAAKHAIDPKTQRLADAVIGLAADVQEHAGVSWHGNSRANEALAEAVLTYLSALKQPPSAADDLFGPFDPKTLGQTLARVRSKADVTREPRTLYEKIGPGIRKLKGEKP